MEETEIAGTTRRQTVVMRTGTKMARGREVLEDLALVVRLQCARNIKITSLFLQVEYLF